MKTTSRWSVVMAMALAAGMTGWAAEPEGWKVEVTPYAWMLGIDGDVEFEGYKVDFDQSHGATWSFPLLVGKGVL